MTQTVVSMLSHVDAPKVMARSEVRWVVDAVMVCVDDVDAHRQRSQAVGARPFGETAGGESGRRYRVEDHEGNRWTFMQRQLGY